MARKKTQKISYKEAHDRAWWPLFLFFFFIILLVCGFLIYKYWQRQVYYGSIKSFVFTSTTGPVSPEYQSTKALKLTADGCVLTTINSKETTTQNCTISSNNFYKLVNLYYSSDVGTKMSYNNNSTSKNLIGGPTKTFTVNFSNGSSSSTAITTDFKANAQNFIDTVATYVAQFKQYGY